MTPFPHSVVLVLMSLAMISCRDASSDGEVMVNQDREAPDFSSKKLSDEKVTSISDHRGKVVVVKFWWSKCMACNEKMDHLQNLVAGNPQWKKDVVFLAVSVDPTFKEARDHLEMVRQESLRSSDNGNDGDARPAWTQTTNTWHDPRPDSGAVYRAYVESQGLPVTYVLDREGILRAMDSPQSEDVFDLEATLTSLLQS